MSKKHTYQITGQQNCGNCLYYRRHYICREGAFYSLSYGHCIFPRLKKRPPNAACPHWAPADGRHNVPGDAKKDPSS